MSGQTKSIIFFFFSLSHVHTLRQKRKCFLNLKRKVSIKRRKIYHQCGDFVWTVDHLLHEHDCMRRVMHKDRKATRCLLFAGSLSSVLIQRTKEKYYSFCARSVFPAKWLHLHALSFERRQATSGNYKAGDPFHDRLPLFTICRSGAHTAAPSSSSSSYSFSKRSALYLS